MARVFLREIFRCRGSTDFLLNPFSKHQKGFYSSTALLSDFANFSLERKTITLIQTCQNPTHFYQIHTHFITSGFVRDPQMAGRIVRISMDFCDIDYMLLIFKCIDYPDTFCVNAVLKAYTCSSLPNKAVDFYFEMRNEDGVLFKPNTFTFPPLISCCGKIGDSVQGRKCHGQTLKFGVVDGVLQVENALIHMYACCGLIDIAWKVFDKMSVRDLVSWNSIVDGYVKVGDMMAAHKLFDVMPQRNVVSWNVMMKGYLDVKNPGVGLKLFRKMVGMGSRGNDISIVNVLTACGRSCRLREGASIHAALIRTFVSITVIIGTALIDMYSKCGKPDVAQVIFDGILIKNLVCWNAMILGQSLYGNPNNGLLLFNKMAKLGEVAPDEVTYVGVLCACARAGLLTQGKHHFVEMTNVFDIRPTFAHHWCMANLLASHGLVHDAVEILKNMVVDTDVSVSPQFWAGLLGICRFEGDIMVGERIAKALIEDDPSNGLYHTLLLSVYAVAGRWEDVARMRCTMKERGVGEMVGFSLVELTEMVHKLQVGDEWKGGISRLGEHG